MIHSSNIHVMTNALLKVAKILRRDFNEIEKIQNSKNNIDKFVFKSIENIKESISYDLLKARPEAKIFYANEESNIEKHQEYYFVIEPVSGTKNYSSGISYFASSITLIIKEEIEATVIYDPIRDEMFFAEKGKGAYLNNSRIRVSSNNQINKAFFVLENIDLMNALPMNNQNYSELYNFRVLGCSSLDLANLACGKIDCYLTAKLNLNQALAGSFLVREAGGFVHKPAEVNYSIVANNNIIANF